MQARCHCAEIRDFETGAAIAVQTLERLALCYMRAGLFKKDMYCPSVRKASFQSINCVGKMLSENRNGSSLRALPRQKEIKALIANASDITARC